MALSILNNIPGLAAQNELSQTNLGLQRTLYRLSSGSRINSGADDAAGLAIADGLRANISALTQSARNTNDGVGHLQVADGALAQVTTLLNRAVTLATQASTGTVSDAQRISLDSEFSAIKAEINSIGATTTFNGAPVFSASMMSVFLSDGGATTSTTISVTTGALTSLGIGLGANASNTLSAIANPVGLFASNLLTASGNAGVYATGTLTSDATNVSVDDTVTVGTKTYTFKADGAGAANTVDIGADAAETLVHLALAVNLTGVAGTDYGVGTAINAEAAAGTPTATTIVFTAKAAGTGGNLIDFEEVSTHLSVSGAHLAGGATAQIVVGAQTYTFVSALTGAADEVKIGTTAALTLANLAAAVNDTGVEGVNYGTGTGINATVTAGTPTATTITFTAKADGTGGNLLATTDTDPNLSWSSGATLAGGAQAQVVVGDNTYKFVAALTASTTAGEVLRGATAAATLANLAAAVNLGAGAGVAYGSETVANDHVTAGTPTASTITFTAKVAGTGGNTIATTFTNGTNMGWSSGTVMAGGSGSAGLTTADAGKAALTAITAAVSTVAGLRGTIGAGVNQLHAASAVIGNQIQNLTAGEDGIRGANIPEEIANMARFNILTQTGIAALSQANSQQQAILALLR